MVSVLQVVSLSNLIWHVYTRISIMFVRNYNTNLSYNGIPDDVSETHKYSFMWFYKEHWKIDLVYACWRAYDKVLKRLVKVVLGFSHYNDVIMGTIASQITSLTIGYSTACSDADKRKHQSSASLAFVRGIHLGPVNSPYNWPVTRKTFPFDDVIMICLPVDLVSTPSGLALPWYFINRLILCVRVTLGIFYP